MLFQINGKPLKFKYEPSVKVAREFILEHGGVVVPKGDKSPAIKLVPQHRKFNGEIVFSVAYLHDCLEREKLLNLENYVIKGSDKVPPQLLDINNYVGTTATPAKTFQPKAKTPTTRSPSVRKGRSPPKDRTSNTVKRNGELLENDTAKKANQNQNSPQGSTFMSLLSSFAKFISPKKTIVQDPVPQMIQIAQERAFDISDDSVSTMDGEGEVTDAQPADVPPVESVQPEVNIQPGPAIESEVPDEIYVHNIEVPVVVRPENFETDQNTIRNSPTGEPVQKEPAKRYPSLAKRPFRLNYAVLDPYYDPHSSRDLSEGVMQIQELPPDNLKEWESELTVGRANERQWYWSEMKKLEEDFPQYDLQTIQKALYMTNGLFSYARKLLQNEVDPKKLSIHDQHYCFDEIDDIKLRSGIRNFPMKAPNAFKERLTFLGLE